MYSNNTLCPVCEQSEYTQSHLINWNVLLDILPLNRNIEFNHLKGSAEQQAEFVKIYEKYEESSLPGLYTGPVHPQASTLTGRVRRSDDIPASG